MANKLFKTQRQYARIAANMDGKYQGLSQKEAEKALRYVYLLDVTARLGGYQSPLEILVQKSKRRVKRELKKGEK